MSSHKLMVIVLLSLIWMANTTYADWQPYSEPVNGPTYGTSDGLSAVEWNSSIYLFSADYDAGIYYSTNEGESWVLGDAINGTNATFIIADPYVPGNVYIARDAAGDEGFWVSENGGQTFTDRNGSGQNLLTNTSITSIYIDANSPYDVYVTCRAVSGDNQERIFVTDDEGETWKETFESFPKSDGPYELDVTAMYIEPGDADEIWVGSSLLSYPAVDLANLGVWHSTDGGNNWDQVLGGVPVGAYYPIHDIRKIIQNPEFPTVKGPYCYVNTQRVDYIQQHIDIALFKRGEEVNDDFDWVWTIYGYHQENEWGYFTDFDVIKTPDPDNSLYSLLALSHSWSEGDPEPLFEPGILRMELPGTPALDMDNISDGIYLPYATSFAKDPDDVTVLYTGTRGGPFGESSYDFYGGVYKSTDFGASWTEKTEGMHTCSSLDIEYFSNTIWAGGTQPDPGEDGNMLTLKESGEDWSNRFMVDDNSLRDFITTGTGQYIAVAVGGGENDEDSIYVSENRGESFTAEYGYYSDPYIANVYGFARRNLYIYATLDAGPRIIKRGFNPTEDTWEEFDDGWPSGIGDEAMAIDASQPADILYAGSKSLGLYKLDEDDPTPEWESAGLNDVNFNIDDIAVIEIFSAATADSLFVAGKDQTPNYRLLRSLNGGTSWAYSENGITHKNIKGMESHPDHRSVILATSLEGSSTPHVYITINGGSDWTDFSGGLNPAVLNSIKDIEIGPTNPTTQGRILYVGTDNGIYETNLIVFDENIASNTTWSDDYPIFVIGDITVNSGVTLTIEAGAEIYFAPEFDVNGSGSDQNSCELIVKGTLMAQGSSGDSIKFIPASDNPYPGDWVGIFLDSSASAEMSYCSVQYSDIGIEMRKDAEAVVSHSHISNHSSMGIYNYQGDLKLADSYISNNWTYGLYGYMAIDSVSNTTFHKNNSYGIRLSGTTSSNDDSYINKVTVTTNDTSGMGGTQYGIYIEDNDYISIDSSEVRYYDEGGIKLDNSDALVLNCTFTRAGLYGLYCLASSPKVRDCLFDSLDVDIYDFSFGTGAADLGKNTEGEYGYNSILDSNGKGIWLIYFSGFTMNPEEGDDLYAQQNWWGDPDGPDTSKLYDRPPLFKMYYKPYLEENPQAKLASQLPPQFSLSRNYPNPFNANTIISFSLDKPEKTALTIYNVLGQKVATPVDEMLDAGSHSVIWDGRNSSGSPVVSGIYFYTIQFGDHFDSKKMLLLR